MFQYVKYFVETEKNHNKPLLHFIISASINLHLESISASYAAVHVDKKYKPRVVLSRGYEKQNIELESFSCDVMNPIFKLGKPISPEYPPQFKLLDKIDEMQRLKIISDKALDRFREDLTRRGDWLTDSQLKRLIDKQSFPLALRNKLHAIVDTNTTPYKYLNDKNSMFSINGGLKTKLETSTTECKRIKIAR